MLNEKRTDLGIHKAPKVGQGCTELMSLQLKPGNESHIELQEVLCTAWQQTIVVTMKLEVVLLHR